MNKSSECKAQVHGDQWYCDICQLVWDIDDPEPPKCSPVGFDDLDECETGRHEHVGIAALKNIREIIGEE